MFIKTLKMYASGYIEVEFTSGSHTHKVGTFFIQIPYEVRSYENVGKSFEITNSFMCEKLHLPPNSDPLEWYMNKEKELGPVAGEVGHPQNIFCPFMNAVGEFFGYNREKEDRDWQESTPVQ